MWRMMVIGELKKLDLKGILADAGCDPGHLVLESVDSACSDTHIASSNEAYQ